MNRRGTIAVGEYYHIFNRGVDRKKIFHRSSDFARFRDSLFFFNTEKPAWLVNDLRQVEGDYHPNDDERLVDIIAYCINPNHFHIIVKENKEGGLAAFMKKVSTGYAMYYNKKNMRSGVLFQGRFKSVHIPSSDLLLYVSAYVNCNSQIHGGVDAMAYPWCSFSEYVGIGAKEFCQKESILGQFKKSEDYKSFCLEKAAGMKDKKDMQYLHLE